MIQKTMTTALIGCLLQMAESVSRMFATLWDNVFS